MKENNEKKLENEYLNIDSKMLSLLGLSLVSLIMSLLLYSYQKGYLASLTALWNLIIPT